MSGKKSILLEAYDCDPYKGSEFSRSWNWATNYTKAGYEVWCLTSIRGKEGIERFLKANSYPNLHFIFVAVSRRLDRIATQGDSAFLYLHYLLWLSKALKAARNVCKDHSFEFAHHVSWGSLQGGSHLWRLDLPLVFGPVGGGQYPPSIFKEDFYEGWRSEQIRKLIGYLFINYNPNTIKTLRKALGTLVVNQDTKKLAINLGAREVQTFIDVNLNADILPDKYPGRKSQQKLRVLWVGGLKFRKGLPLVLEALSHVPKDIPLHLTIYGDGEFSKYLPKLIDQLEVNDRVSWKGSVPHSQLQSAYMSHDVFMFCTMRESLGLQFFEAMSYGLPIITLDLHGAKTAVPDDASIKVKVLKRFQVINDLTKAVIFMQQHPLERVEMGKRAFHFTKKLSTLDKVKTIEKLVYKSKK